MDFRQAAPADWRTVVLRAPSSYGSRERRRAALAAANRPGGGLRGARALRRGLAPQDRLGPRARAVPRLRSNPVGTSGAWTRTRTRSALGRALRTIRRAL